MTRRSLIVLVALAAWGCDGGSEDLDGGPPDAGGDGGIVIPDRVPIAMYCDLAPTFWCSWLDRCRRGCDAYFGESGVDPEGWCDTLSGLVSEGRVAYDEARASECLRLALSELDATCEGGEESRGGLHDCVPFAGLGTPGDECVLPFPLESTCDPSVGTCSAQPFTARCPGTCLAFLSEGEDCDPTIAGATCAPDLLCIDATCVRPAAASEACDLIPCADGLRCVYADDGSASCQPIRNVDETCASLVECADGLGCDPDSLTCVETLSTGSPCRSTDECAATDHCTFDGTCAPRLENGEACSGDDECIEGLVCAFDADATEPRCQARAGDGEDCDPGLCDDDLWCRHTDGGNLCAPIVAVGEDCSGEPAWTPRPRCEAGAFCNDGGSCETQRGPDEPCDSTAFGTSACDVEAGVLCDPFTDTCLGPGATEGARCLGVCAEGLYCDVDICLPRVAVGEPCPLGETCIEGSACVDLDGTGPKCWEQATCAE